MPNNNVMQNYELLKTYLDKYHAWGADDNKIADYKEAQAYYCRAIDAVNDFYRTEAADSAAKNAYLYTGTFIAMKAVNGFEHVIARYKDDYYKDAANKGTEFIIPGMEQDTQELYSDFVRSIRDLTPEMDLYLRKYTVGQTYINKHHEDDKEYYVVPVTEDGMKINHLETIIRYCEEMIRAINLLSNEDSSDRFDAEGANLSFEKACCKLTGFQKAYEDVCNDEIERKDLIILCDRCVKMYKDFLDVQMMINDQNSKRKSEIMVEDFKDNLMTLDSIAESKDSENLPSPYKIVGWIGHSMEIANAIKKDFTGSIFKS